MSTIEIPRTLPVAHLSVSSVRTFIACPERWRRLYIEGEWEPASGPMIIGKAVGAAEATNYQDKIVSGEDLATDVVLDAYSDEWDHAVEREEIDWGEAKPATLKDEGARVLTVYHNTVAPQVAPTSVEREFQLRLPGADWTFRGFIDVETADRAVVDLKVKAKALSMAEAAADMQATAYLLARRQEAAAGFGEPADRFDFHVLKKLKTPAVDTVPTTRTDTQLDAFLNRLSNVAAEIQWRTETDNWGYAAPGHWACGEKWCGFWSSCPGGGLR